jgi:hypothetical protein
MMYKSLLSFIPSLFLGFLIVDTIWETRTLRQLMLKIFIGFGIGLGQVSLLLFLWLLLNNRVKGFELIIGGIIIFGILVRFRGWWIQLAGIFPRRFSIQSAWINLALFIAFIGSVVFSFDAFLKYSLMHQHGDRDAQAIWNLHARIIYRDVSNWKSVFSPQFDPRFHPDYPLLLPLNVVWGWNLLRSETTRVPIALAGIFTFGLVGLLFSAVVNLKSWGQAYLATIVLMGTPYFILLGTFQIADIPFAFFVLSTMVLFAFYSKERKIGLLVLAGLTAGLSAWTKNEGILFVVSTLTAIGVYAFREKGSQKLLFYFGGGLLLPILIVLYTKIFLAPPNDMFMDFNANLLFNRMISLERLEIIFSAIGKSITNFGDWKFSIVIVLIIFSIIVGFRVEDSQREILLICTLILAMQLTGYIFIYYVITPYPLEFHLLYSLDRLLFHLYPAALFLFFSTVSTSEDISYKRASTISKF